MGYSQIHAARPGDPPFQVRTWRRANPSFDHFPDLQKTIRSEAKDARSDPAERASFDALRLNLGVSDVREVLILDAATWKRIEVADPERSGRWVLGLDVASGAAMSAASGYWPETGALEVMACFPEIPDLLERGLADGVGRSYKMMADRGELFTAGRRVADVGDLLSEVRSRWGTPDAVVTDTWRQQEVRQELEDCGFPVVPFTLRRQGYLEGGEDLRSFRKACLRGKVKPGVSLLLRSAMLEARGVCDPAGNEKLAKGTQAGRRLRAKDDAVAAAILAVSEGQRRFPNAKKRERRGVYFGKV